MTSPVTQYSAAADGVQLAWTTVGSGCPILLIPAITATIDRVASELVAVSHSLGRAIATYDWRGSGRSTRGGTISMQHLVDDIASVATDLAGAGEIVCTNVVRELVAGKSYLFSEREPASLKGVEEPVRLFNLESDSR